MSPSEFLERIVGLQTSNCLLKETYYILCSLLHTNLFHVDMHLIPVCAVLLVAASDVLTTLCMMNNEKNTSNPVLLFKLRCTRKTILFESDFKPPPEG